MIEEILLDSVRQAIRELYNSEIKSSAQVRFQRTRTDFTGDFTLVVFPLLQYSKKSPEQTAIEIGDYLKANVSEVDNVNVVKGFLNISLKQDFWFSFFTETSAKTNFGFRDNQGSDPVVIEYSSPNTNKPLHLGHIRNNLLGWSVAEILKANGKDVKKVNLVNDRGIHICKTMLAYLDQPEKKTPDEQGVKGDKMVGNLYVQFEKANTGEINRLMESGKDRDEAYRTSSYMVRAMELLRKWEDNDAETRRLWEIMNGWVYQGFDATYRRLGVDFDRIYHESDTYLLGKELVQEGLEKQVFFKKPDGSVWIDLSSDGLDEKLLLRSDGTSVYMTQDLGTAQVRYDDYHPSGLLYVVGNEQDYHFNVLKLILKKLGRTWADYIKHISYGMVELPQGKMKSREGTVVDADDLMEEMHQTARKVTLELGKIEDPDSEEASELFEIIGMGALKYFILKVDPRKNMLFNPEESIDFNGNTGPFIQYTHARIRSLLRKGKERGYGWHEVTNKNVPDILSKEISLLKIIYSFPEVLSEASEQLSPALIANYVYDLAREYNQYYQEVKVLQEPDESLIPFRLGLSELTGKIIHNAMGLLGIRVPEKM